MKNYLQTMIEPLLADPQGLEISETTDEQGDLLTVKVSRPDMGRVIGRGGATVEAIRVLVRTVGSINGRKVGVKN